MNLNLFHALRKNTGGGLRTSQTDRRKTTTSGDSRERPAFDWREVPGIDEEEVDLWFGVTDAKSRQFPLQLALQVHDELERELMTRERIDDGRLREIRGGLAALARFAALYDGVLTSRRKDGGEDA